MKNLKTQILFVFVVALALFARGTAYGQITPSDDAYTSSTNSSTNYGTASTLSVSTTATATTAAFIRFDLSSIPSTYTGANIAQATLKLYVNAVTTAGSFNVNYVTGSWSEKTIKQTEEPGIGTTIVSDVNLATTSKGEYVLINVTPAVVAWLDGTETNYGVALVANSPLSATFDSKENTAASHPAELDVVYAGIAGLTTASGSGLIGGGTGGTLSLALTSACSTNQVLQWNGSSWACSAAGTGTISGITAGTGLTGGGTSGSVALSLTSNSCGAGNALTALPFGCSPFATLGANTFTGNQTLNGTLSGTGNITANGTVSGGFVNATTGFTQGGTLFAFGSYGPQNVFLGFAGDSATTGGGNTASGALALLSNTSGGANTASGDQALTANTTGYGNVANGASALYRNSTGGWNTATGLNALQYNSIGADNTATGTAALYYNTTGSFNAAFGYSAGMPTSSQATTGSYNTFLGANTNPGTQLNLSYATAIGANAVVSASNAMTLGASGAVGAGNPAAVNVGIGTATPQYRLDVSYGDAIVRGAGNFSSVANLFVGDTAHEVQAVTGVGIGLGAFSSLNTLVVTDNFGGGSNGCQYGYVGIRTSCPTSLLTLAQGQGAALADGWNTYSSRRWKKNIQPIQNALGKVEQLRGVTYDLKDSGKHEIGVIAEEVGAVVPELVSFEKNGKDARGVDYSRLTALLIEAVKQQEQEVQEQRRQIRSQQQQIRSQQRQITRLNGKVGVLETAHRTAAPNENSPSSIRSSAIKTCTARPDESKPGSRQRN